MLAGATPTRYCWVPVRSKALFLIAAKGFSLKPGAGAAKAVIVNRLSAAASCGGPADRDGRADATRCRLQSSNVRGRRCAVLDAELLVNVVEVLADGRRFGVEDHGDLATGLAARYPDQDLRLPRC